MKDALPARTLTAPANPQRFREVRSFGPAPALPAPPAVSGHSFGQISVDAPGPARPLPAVSGGAVIQRAVEERNGKYHSDIDPEDRAHDSHEEAEQREMEVMAAKLLRPQAPPRARPKPAASTGRVALPPPVRQAEPKPRSPAEDDVSDAPVPDAGLWKESRRAKRARDHALKPRPGPKPASDRSPRGGKGGNSRVQPPARRPHQKYLGGGGGRSGEYAVRDENALNNPDLPPGNVRVYRAEVNKFDPQYSHTSIDPDSNAHLYTPKPAPGEYANVGKGKKTPKKNPDRAKYAREFLRGREGQPQGTMGWFNFADPYRAAEFQKQKANNPKEAGKKFVIKSFEVPHETFSAIRGEAVHERQRKQYPSKPINVDRAAPNQYGVQQHHVELMNATMVPGSAREEDPRALEREHGPRYSMRHRRAPDNGKPQKRQWHGKGTGNLSTMMREMEQGEDDARREAESDEEY